jgi:hypothetical protein
MTIPIFRKNLDPARQGAGPYSRSHPQIRAARGDLGIGPGAHDPEIDGDDYTDRVKVATNSRSFSGSGMSGKAPPRGGGARRK